ncbi:putative defensin-like protein [Helianthus anomalus]
MLFGLLLIITASSQTVDENDMKINLRICDDYIPWPAPNCDNGQCFTMCKNRHGKRSWGKCNNATSCDCEYFCA